MKRALIIGLNYAGSQYALHGCEIDAANIYNRMPRNAYGATLTGTYSAERFYADCASLRDACTDKDTTYICFSGHGTYLDDFTEDDGFQGGICFWNGSKIEVIPEIDFRRAVEQIAGSVFVFLDCCFAGEFSKMPQSVRRTAKFAPFNANEMRVQQFMTRPQTRAAAPKPKMYWLLACAFNEVSYDTGNGGLFTSAFVRVYDATKQRSIRRLIEYAKINCEPDQTPNFKCENGARPTKTIF
jgi:hypothetical protein